jgi:hypothetical protein
VALVTISRAPRSPSLLSLMAHSRLNDELHDKLRVEPLGEMGAVAGDAQGLDSEAVLDKQTPPWR